MAVLTPRLVLVCAVPAFATLLTVLWTRRRRKNIPVRKPFAEKDSAQPQVQESTDSYARSSSHSALLEKENCSTSCSTSSDKQVGRNTNAESLELLRQPKGTIPTESEDISSAVRTELNQNQTADCGAKVQLVQTEQSFCETLEQLSKQDNQVDDETAEKSHNHHNLTGDSLQELLPKMHVKSDENQITAKSVQECHLSPRSGSTSDLSDRQNSPVNSDASFCDVSDETKVRRSRGSCRLSEESRDSAMGGEEDLGLVDGPVCDLLESGPSASFSESRTEFGQELLLPELQPPVNGESGCFNDLDEVLESPPPSIYSDGHSEGSCDSGKGGSDIQVISNGDLAKLSENALLVYEFELAQELCGRLIGKNGKHVNFIKSSSNASVYIKTHPFNARLKLCAVQGTKSEIQNALDLIRKRFPLSQHPSLTLAQVNIPLSCGVMVPETLQLHLPEGVTSDVILSSMVSAGHFFVQQPTHPTYPSLNRLDTCMTTCYSQMDTPQLPQPVEVGVICACPVLEGWFRAQVVNIYENSEDCDVKFVDYGGYSCVPMSRLRQIRSDFMTLPFQASECYLANVKPTTEAWSLEACATFEELAQGQILQSLVVGHAEDGIPYVHLYRVQGVSTVFINRELVNRGVAQWLEVEI